MANASLRPSGPAPDVRRSAYVRTSGLVLRVAHAVAGYVADRFAAYPAPMAAPASAATSAAIVTEGLKPWSLGAWAALCEHRAQEARALSRSLLETMPEGGAESAWDAPAEAFWQWIENFDQRAGLVDRVVVFARRILADDCHRAPTGFPPARDFSFAASSLAMCSSPARKMGLREREILLRRAETFALAYLRRLADVAERQADVADVIRHAENAR